MKERILQLCKQKGVRIGTLEKDLGLSKGYITKIDKYSPSLAKAEQIARYLGVSVDYLASGKELQEYYLNGETADIAQRVYDNPNLRMLFDAAKDVKPENVRLAAEMLLRLKDANPDG